MAEILPPFYSYEEAERSLDAYLRSEEQQRKYQESIERMIRGYNELFESQLYNRVVDDKSNPYNEVQAPFREVRITTEAYKKMQLLASKVIDVVGYNAEFSFYLLNDKEKQEQGDIAVRDVYVQMDQEVGSGHVHTHPTGLLSASDEIQKQGKVIVGWGHSHGDFPTFHSSTDDFTLERMTISYGQRKEIVLDDFADAVRKVPVQMFYSMVVNANGADPYSAIGVMYRNQDKERQYFKNTASLAFLEEQNGIVCDEQSLISELHAKINTHTSQTSQRKGALRRLYEYFKEKIEMYLPKRAVHNRLQYT